MYFWACVGGDEFFCGCVFVFWYVEGNLYVVVWVDYCLVFYEVVWICNFLYGFGLYVEDGLVE